MKARHCTFEDVRIAEDAWRARKIVEKEYSQRLANTGAISLIGLRSNLLVNVIDLKLLLSRDQPGTAEFGER